MNKWLKKLGAGMLASTSMLATACLDDGNKNVAGGVAEETNIAENITLTGAIQAIHSQVSVMGHGSDESQESVEGSVTVPYIKGIKLCKLDSLTFDIGECFAGEVKDGASYEVKASGVWRYGLLVIDASDMSGDELGEIYGDASASELDSLLDEYSYSLHSIIDARDSAYNVNVLTEWKYYHVDNLIKAGLSVAEAMGKAEQDLLDSIGVRGNQEGFGKMDISGTTESDAVLIAASYLLGTPSEDGPSIKSRIASKLSFEARYNFIHHPVFWQSMGVEQPSDSFVDLVARYVSNSISGYVDIGRCESGNDGRVLTTESADFGIVATPMADAGLGLKCSDGFWIWHVPYVEHVMDTLADERDGQVYRTTTIAVDGETQTWMAEDLKYNLAGSTCLGDSAENCDRYGRLYSLATLGQVNYEGVCPDGWGIPSMDDWKTLENAVGGEKAALKLMKRLSWQGKKFRFTSTNVAGKFAAYNWASDVIEFSAVPNVTPLGEGLYANVPSSTESDEDYGVAYARFHGMHDDIEWGLDDSDAEEPIRVGVRCIKR